MRKQTTRKLLSIFLSVVLATTTCLPSLAFAQETVRMNSQGGAADADRQVSRLVIDDVAAPQVGSALDDTAKVSSAGGESWDIPVMWVGSNMELAITAEEGQTYLPALAFYLPDGYAVAESTDGYTVELSDSLTQLFGGQEIISVYDASTGITYIIPASLRGLFARGNTNEEEQASIDVEDEESAQVDPGNTGQVPAEPAPAKRKQNGKKSVSLVDIYCSQTAKDELSTSDLEWVIDLIINKLQPQAVNLLLEKFPAFKQGFEEGKIGREIGLYIYYEYGDKDGDVNHESAESALAYVRGRHYVSNGTVHYGYMLGVDLESITGEDKSGKLVILKDGKEFETFQNTLVHEMFHAFMDDYNRTGMAGTTTPEHAITELMTPDEEAIARYKNTHYPVWFIEGTASAVENTYQYRRSYFELLAGASQSYAAYTPEAIVQNYLTRIPSDKVAYFLLEASSPDATANGESIDPSVSQYVSGYLAVLYLGELAARQAGDSSISQAGGVTSISSDKIRMGLNSILERMNKGETLDQVIYGISPTDAAGNKYYGSSLEFERTFLLEGREGGNVNIPAAALAPSAQFVCTFLNYMHALALDPSRTNLPNGSMLFGFDEDFTSPLDPSKDAASEAYKIVDSNTAVESTVPDSTALAGGGKSQSGTPSATTQSQPAADPAPPENPEAAAAEEPDVRSESTADPSAPSGTVADSQPESMEQSEEEAPASPEAAAVSEAPDVQGEAPAQPEPASQQLPDAA